MKYHVNVIVSRTSPLADRAVLIGRGNETGWIPCVSYAQAKLIAGRVFNLLTYLEGVQEHCGLPDKLRPNQPRVSLSNSSRTIHATIVRDGYLGEDEQTLEMRKGTLK